jgi:hypothetical protein
MHIYRLETIGSLDGLVAREEAAPVPSAGEVLVRGKGTEAHVHPTQKRTGPIGMAG